MNLYAKSAAVKSLLTVVAVAMATGLALSLSALGVTDSGIVLTLLMAVVVCSWAFGLIYSILSSVLAIVSHAYFFSVPIYSLEVANPQHLIAFVFLVGVGVVVSQLSDRLRDQVRNLAIREQRLEALHRLGQALSGQIERDQVVQTAEALLSEILDAPVRIAGATLPVTGTRAFALSGSQRSLGWVMFDPGAGPDPFLPERRVWIETLLSPVALALERVALIAERAEQARQFQATQTRNTILHGISHDLRTPLTVISATAGSLLEQTPAGDPRRTDLESLAQESQSVVRQVENLLELTGLTSGSVAPRREWVPVEDLVYPCLESFAGRYPDVRPSSVLPEEPTLCRVDETLVSKALTNLLENAALYAPGPVEVEVVAGTGALRFQVKDRGPGVADQEKTKIFGQFVRGQTARKASGHRGTGLGLALVQSVANLHGGGAGVEDRPGGGSIFWFELGQDEPMPALWGTP